MRAKEFVAEALTPQQTAQLFKNLGKEYDANIHNNVFKGKSRIYIPLPDSEGPDIPQQSATQSEVQKAVQSVGYKIDDYQSGIASKTDDPNRKIRIGKLIKDQSLLQQFANDKTRAATKQQNLVVAISRDPVDIGGMSTDRGWTSCMDLDGGINKRYVPTEIKNGAIIAYLINDDDREISRPKARILLKPYYYNNHMIIVPDKVYGTAPRSFPKLVRKFAKWANSGSPEGDYRLARGSYRDDTDPNQYHTTTYDNIETLSPDKKIGIAKNEATPVEVLDKLAVDRKPEIRTLVASNTSASLEALIKLSQDRDEEVRESVAENASTPPEVLVQLSQDRDLYVRGSVASNISAPPEALIRLAQDRNNEIRAEVAENPSTPPEAFIKLAQDRELNVRYAVVDNPKTPPEALAKMVQDRDNEIRAMVADNDSTLPETLVQLAQDRDEDVRAAVASNTSAPPEALIRLAQDRDDYVRAEVAYNTSTPPELLVKLAQDRDEVVRRKVGANKSTPPEVLAQLAKDENKDVRNSVARNLKARGKRT